KDAIEKKVDAGFRCDLRAVKEIGELSLADLAPYHAVYLFNVAKPAPKLWDVLKEYVQRGGGLAVVPAGKDLDPGSYNGKEAQALLPGALKSIVTQKDPGTAWDWSQKWIYQHSLLKPVEEWKNLGLDFLEQPRTAVSYWEAAKNAGGEVL